MRSLKRQRCEPSRWLGADRHCKPLIRRGLRRECWSLLDALRTSQISGEVFFGVNDQCGPQMFGTTHAFVGPSLGPHNARENIFSHKQMITARMWWPAVPPYYY